MKICVITDAGIDVYKSWSAVKAATGLEKNDFTNIGGDFVIQMNDETFNIVKDIKLLENVAAQKMFTKNKLTLPDIASLITLGLVFIMVVS